MKEEYLKEMTFERYLENAKNDKEFWAETTRIAKLKGIEPEEQIRTMWKIIHGN